MRISDPASIAQALVQLAPATLTQASQSTSASNSSGQFQQQLLALVQQLVNALVQAVQGKAAPGADGAGDGSAGAASSPQSGTPATQSAESAAAPTSDPGQSAGANGGGNAPPITQTGVAGAGSAAQAAAPGAQNSSSQVVDTGTGKGQTYNAHNDTNRVQNYLYSDANGHKAVMQLQPGQFGSFTGGNNQPGIRIQSCGPNGETRSPANQALAELGSQMTAKGPVNNPDVSNVDGNLSYDGRGTNIEISNNLGQKVGNLTGDAYRNWNDDTKQDPSNPMTMAQTSANTFDIHFSDADQTLSTPGIR